MDILQQIIDTHTKIITLGAIWVTNPVPVINGKRCARLTEGMKLKVVDGVITDSVEGEEPTHIISGCKGTISSSMLLMSVVDLSSNELSEIDLSNPKF